MCVCVCLVKFTVGRLYGVQKKPGCVSLMVVSEIELNSLMFARNVFFFKRC